MLFLSRENWVEIAIIFLGDGRKQKIEHFLSPGKLQFVRFLPLFFASILSLVVWNAFRHADKILGFFKENWLVFVQSYTNVPIIYKLVFTMLLLLSVCTRVALMLTMPISYDEAWTYLNFTSNGILTSLVYYPAPNNHVLYSLLTNISSHLPFSTLFNLRFPSIVAFTMCSFFIFYSLSKLISFQTSLMAVTLFMFLFPSVFYGYNARGYILLVLFMAGCCYSTIRLLQVSDSVSETRHLVFLSVCITLGIFTMPSFLYAAFSVSIYLLAIAVKQKRLHLLYKLLITGLVTVACTFTLYLPIIVVSGIDSIISNRYVLPIDRSTVLSELYTHFNTTSLLFFEVGIMVVGLFILGSSIYSLLKNKHVEITYFSMTIFAFAPVLILAHSVIPFPRTWIYLIIPFLYIFAVGIDSKNKLVISITWIIIGGFVLHQSLTLRDKLSAAERISYIHQELSNRLISLGINSIYCNHRIADTYIRFEYESRNIPLKLKYSRSVDICTESVVAKDGYQALVLEDKLDPECDNYNLDHSFNSSLVLYKLD